MTTSAAPVIYAPGWQVPTSDGVRQITLQPDPIGGWAEVDIGGHLQTLVWTPVDELADGAVATIVGLGVDATLEARRVVSDFSSFLRSPRFRGALLRSIVLGLLGFIVGIGIAVVWRTLELPGMFSTVIAVFVTFALASIPFRGTNAIHTEYRLVLAGVPREALLVSQSGRSSTIATSTSTALADATRTTPPAWPSERSSTPVMDESTLEAPGAGVLAHLVARKTDSGLLGVWSSELWLLPDGLLSVGTGLAGSIAQSMDPALPVVRRLTSADIDAMAAIPRSQRIPWSEVAAATLQGGLLRVPDRVLPRWTDAQIPVGPEHRQPRAHQRVGTACAGHALRGPHLMVMCTSRPFRCSVLHPPVDSR